MSRPKLERLLSKARERVRTLEEELTVTNQGLVALTLDLEERVDARTAELRARAAQQEALAGLSRRALAAADLRQTQDDALETARTTLAVDGVTLFVPGPEPDALVLLGAAGPRFSDLGPSGIPAGTGCPAGLALRSEEPVVVEDLDADPRFSPSDLLSGVGVASSAWVVVPGRAGPHGVLGVHSVEPRRCTPDETLFLQSVADVLAAAVARAQAEEALAERSRDLERSNTDLEQFAYVVSHDLRAPLRTISGFIGLLRQHAEDALADDEEAREYIDFAVGGARQMHALITDLLAWSRVGTRGLPPEPLPLDDVLDQALSALGADLDECSATVTRDPLPTVYGDPIQLTQLFQNLIGNAVKFAGDEPPRVHVGAEEAEEGWRVTVRDNGIGIAPEHRERIFEVFQRLHRQDDYAGTGIGLAICRRIVERHGGQIRVTSEPGQGSTFTVTLPQRPEQVP